MKISERNLSIWDNILYTRIFWQNLFILTENIKCALFKNECWSTTVRHGIFCRIFPNFEKFHKKRIKLTFPELHHQFTYILHLCSAILLVITLNGAEFEKTKVFQEFCKVWFSKKSNAIFYDFENFYVFSFVLWILLSKVQNCQKKLWKT